jgi:pimeloyl-ACP methyl ester carboxylesterase
MVGVAQLAERKIVALQVAGSNPVTHPIIPYIQIKPRSSSTGVLFCFSKKYLENNKKVSSVVVMSAKAIIKNTVNIGRFQIPYRIYGEGTEVLVCVNGIQQSMAIWVDFVRRFSPNYKILLFDFPHQGKGKVTAGPSNVSLAEQVGILNELLVAIGIKEKLTLCSASWGGVIAASFTIRYPDRIKKLILSGIGIKPNPKMIEVITQGSKLPMEKRLEIAETLINGFGQDLPLKVKATIISQFERMDKEALSAFYQHGMFILSSDSLEKVIDLKSIDCKTILLRGENDAIIDAEDLILLAAEIPNAEIRTIKDAGHFLHLENDKLMDIYEEILSA